MPEDVFCEIQHFFQANIDWLTMVISEGQRAGQIHKESAAAEIAQAYLCMMEGAMVVGRCMRSTAGPAVIGNTFLLSVLA